MNEVAVLFWDLGGVVLSNGWDEHVRADAARRFSLDAADFEQRHHQAAGEFETGRITLDAYLDRTVFFRERNFSRDSFKEFIFAQSSEKTETRVLLDELTATRRYFLAALNNESAELNAYRIGRFNLLRNFSAFFTSCYLRALKPDPLIYKLALEITQRAPQECIFIDDRPENLEPAKALGMCAIRFESAGQLRTSLAEAGIQPALVGG
jgi:putative hydrolase of the HAD superfamily